MARPRRLSGPPIPIPVLASALALLMGCSSEEPPDPAPPPCTAHPPSPDDPFAQARDPSSAQIDLASRVAGRFMADNQPEQLTWDWGEGTAMFGLSELYRVTGDPSQRDFYQAWIDYYRGAGYRYLITSSDRCPPALSALALYTESCELGYRTIVTDTLHYLYQEALRTPDGGINHLGVNDMFGVSLWLDSLFMFGNVLTRWGDYADDPQALDEYHQQFLIFASHLQSDSGWFRHAHDWPLAEQDDDVFWARGNAWVTAATYDYLRVRQARGEQDTEVEEAIGRQVEAIIAAQDGDTGLWWTVVNRPGETYTETSASALFAVGLARGYRYGFLDAAVVPVIQNAVAGVTSRLVDDGDGPVVTGVSGPTMVGDLDYYAGIETGDGIHYGVGAVILALVETSGL
jgi:unsaturated rhamnogalacturonyl hydrolase